MENLDLALPILSPPGRGQIPQTPTSRNSPTTSVTPSTSQTPETSASDSPLSNNRNILTCNPSLEQQEVTLKVNLHDLVRLVAPGTGQKRKVPRSIKL